MRRVFCWSVGVIAAGAALALVLAALFLFASRGEGDFQKRRGILVGASLEPYAEDSIAEKSWLTLMSSSGLRVTCGLLVPRGSSGRLPAVILLGGKATGRYAIDYAMGVKDVLIVAPDYPYEPRESYSVLEFAADVPEIRHALFDMPPSVMLAIDYLWQRSDVDTNRIIMMGYSFGAPFVPVILANDRRPAFAVMVYGGGDLTSLIRHNVARSESPVLAEISGRLAGLLLRPLEPLDHVERISPVPLLMINGTDDEQIPRENTLMLYERALPPKELIWLDSRHVNPKNVALTQRIIQTIMLELRKRGILPSPGGR
jgi:hypothetical protein